MFGLNKSHLFPLKFRSASSSPNEPSFSDTFPVLKPHSFCFCPFLFRFLPTMSSNQSLFEAVVSSCFDTLAFDLGIRTKVSVNLFAESEGIPTIVGTTKLSGISHSRALHRMLHGHALPSSCAADLVVNESVKVEDNLSLLPYPYPFECGEES